jgi:hypothetical protein
MFWRKAVSDLSRQHHLSDIGQYIYEQANGKNDDPVPKSMQCRKSCGIDQPEKDHVRVQGVDEKTRQSNLRKVSGAEGFYFFGCSGPQVHLFEEDIEDAHAAEEGCAEIADYLPEFQDITHPLGEKIGDENKKDIADPYAGYKAEPTAMAVVDALLDHRKDDWPNRQCQDQPQTQTL